MQAGSKCGYHWRAPWIPPPTLDRIDRDYAMKHRPDEICVLGAGHSGDHRSIAKVTATQR
jgi:hypothetical protein